jgi:hypothetical protein
MSQIWVLKKIRLQRLNRAQVEWKLAAVNNAKALIVKAA